MQMYEATAYFCVSRHDGHCLCASVRHGRHLDIRDHHVHPTITDGKNNRSMSCKESQQNRPSLAA
jgi:hypothetical protein